ncbi:DUF4255 domain-containing protein [Kitasatospora sp. NPDC048239]|uniref:DUF4255 domain-containing protein n=1 Tax=Kitasatospora sp. NPDC048239 TaxID=3364046 RepID=UPI00371B948E
MSTGRAIEAVTQTLRSLLGQVAAQVTARPPDQAREAGTGGAQLNLFLYDVAPNPAWRNLEPPARSAGGALHPPLALDLSYLLTAYGDTQDEAPAHRLLGEAMQLLHDGAVLTRAKLSGVLAAAGVHLQPERVRLTPVHLGIDEQSKLWSGFQTNYRLSVAYRASVVLIDALTPADAPLPVLRRGRLPLDALGQDQGVPVSVGAAPRVDRLTVSAWRGNPSFPARTGDGLAVDGAGLAGGRVRARFDHPRLPAPLWADAAAGSTAERVLLPVPPALPAGVATVTLAIGPPEGPVITSNSLPLAVAVRLGPPALGAVGATTVRVRVPCDRLLVKDQPVLLLVGGAQLRPTAPVRPGAVPSFDVPRTLPARTPLTLRLRVDGIDSVPLSEPAADQTKPLPTAFDPAQQVVLP